MLTMSSQRLSGLLPGPTLRLPFTITLFPVEFIDVREDFPGGAISRLDPLGTVSPLVRHIGILLVAYKIGSILLAF